MINELFGVIARVFPVLMLVAAIAALVFLARAWSRMSSGSVGAGPTLVASSAHVGLQRVPWELQGLAEAIRSNSTQPLDLLLRRAESLGVPVDVPPGLQPQDAVDFVLDQLEQGMGLAPMQAPTIEPAPPNTPLPTNSESLTS